MTVKMSEQNWHRNVTDGASLSYTCRLFLCSNLSFNYPFKKKSWSGENSEKVLLIERLPSFIKETGVVRPVAARLSRILEFP